MTNNQINILCYGDSNTWGYVPGSGGERRYLPEERWTGILQANLGDEVHIIEEGLSGRTTVLNDPDETDKNGSEQLAPILASHKPLDIVVLMLGTNDLKPKFNQSPESIAANIEKLLEVIAQSESGPDLKSAPKVFLISPAHIIKPKIEKYLGGDENVEEKSQGLSALYASIAENHGLGFIDASKILKPSPVDGVHFDEEAHQVLAAAVTRELSVMLGMQNTEWSKRATQSDNKRSI